MPIFHRGFLPVSCLKSLCALFLVLLIHAAFPPGGFGASREMERIVQEKTRVESTLKELRKQLDDYQVKLKNTKKEETRSIGELKNIRAQILVHERLINENQTYLNSLNREIGYLENELETNRRNYGKVSSDFQRIAVAAYKYGGNRDAESVFASGSVNDALVRSRYMGFLTNSVRAKVTDLQASARQMESAREALRKSYREKQLALREQQERLKSYSSRQREKEAVLTDIKKNRQEYSSQIALVRKKQREMQSKIESLIMAQQELIAKEQARAKQIEQQRQRDRQKKIAESKRLEAQRREEEKRRKSAAETPAEAGEKKQTAASTGKLPKPPEGAKEPAGKEVREEPAKGPVDTTVTEIEKVSADFDRSTGALPWPVSNGVVVRHFGSVKDKDLNIVTISNGIDISVPVNSPVRAVSGGKVAQIAYLPTFGNVVIVRHPNSYLTVYANLAKVSVAKGDVIGSQHLIGSSGAMPEGGSVVHFEVWKGKTKQNPEKWLRK